MTKTFDTFLPIFSGFYNTIWDQFDSWLEYELDSEEDFRRNYPDFDAIPFDFIQSNFWDVVDTRMANIGCVEYIIDAFPRWFNGEVGRDIVKDMEYQKLISPREYNFANDAVDVSVEVDVAELAAYIAENEDAFADYLIKSYTSRDGFMSFHSSDVEDWKEETDNFQDFSGNGHYLGSILKFIVENEREDAEMSLYYASNCNEGFSNGIVIDYKRLVEMWEDEKDKN